MVAEFIGTFALIFIGVGAIAADYITGGKVGLTGIALAHGLVLVVMITATGPISGGQFNPAVTIALWTIKKMDTKRTLGYVLAQCAGAIAAAALLKVAIPGDVLANIHMGTPALSDGITLTMGAVTEFILTFFLVFVVLGTIVDGRAPKCGGVFVGLTVVVDILMGGPLTGAAMNPARYIGPALFNGDLSQCALYWLAPIAGGIAAALVYKTQLLEK